MRMIRTVRRIFMVYLALVSLVPAHAQQPGPTSLPVCSDIGRWSKEKYVMGPNTVAITSPLLLTNGRVMVQYRGGISTGHSWQDWYALNPSESDCYSVKPGDCVSGSAATWSPLASLFSTVPSYGPAAFASAVLPNGNVIVEGGEGNLGFVTDQSYSLICSWCGLAFGL